MFSRMVITVLLQALLLNCSGLHVIAAPLDSNLESAQLQSRQSTELPNPLDYAPDFSQDQFPPWPPVKNSNGTNISVENWRGTQLFGWKGCSWQERDILIQTFKDFHKLAKQEALWKDIDWTSPAAKEIWGHGTDLNKMLLESIKVQIKQIYESTRDVYDKDWWAPPYTWDPPWLNWGNLWIRIQCSSEEGDPENGCGDRPKDNPKCPGREISPPEGQNSQVQAYSSPEEKYSRITFCNSFFNGLTSLDLTMNKAKNNSKNYQNDLWNYDNQARVIFHEVTHLNYFMDAPDKIPRVDDVTIRYLENGKWLTAPSYGPHRIKILANYEAVKKGGFFTQRNADSYAWFAMAMYVQQEIGFYPTEPVEQRKPVETPRDGDWRPFALFGFTEEGDNAGVLNLTDANSTSAAHFVPSCPDHTQINSGILGLSSVEQVHDKSQCNTEELSPIPNDIFHAQSGNVYDKFCFNLETTKAWTWTVNSRGKHKQSMPKRQTNPDSYSAFNFELKWEPNAATQGCGQNVISCRAAFANIANSQCGHQGGEQNAMAASSKLEIPNCGTYSYIITGPNMPIVKKPPPPPLPTPFLSQQWCYSADAFGGHGDIHEGAQAGLSHQVCDGLDGYMVRAGDASTNIHLVLPEDGLSDIPYVYDIWWEEGCASSVTEMNAWNPLPDRTDVTCESLLIEDYKNCNNGGIGGKISVGCVTYRFKASLDDSKG